MHKIEQTIKVFLENIDTKTPQDFEVLIEEFGENCKKALRECLLVQRSEEPFMLRMSNIGKPLRQLMLEKLYGREPMSSSMRLRMTYGYIWESFVLFLLKASGLNVEGSEKTSYDISYDKDKMTTIHGTYDLKIDGEIYDIKSASPWSFDNKFTNFASMEADDPFGYVGQAMGYSIADKSHFAGWIVIDKSDGRIKVVEVPKTNYKELARKYFENFKYKIKAIFNNEEIPPCTGVVEETFRKHKTGNLILNKSCEFCPHKYKCHPELQFTEDVMSEAQNKKWKYYVKLGKPDVNS
jgi:hypothetical protein